MIGGMRSAILVMCLTGSVMTGCVSAGVTGRISPNGWTEVRTPGFRVVSTAAPASTLGLIRHLELFQAVVAQITNVQKFEAQVPTHIYVFETEAAFRPFVDRRGISGYFLPQLRANYVGMRAPRSIGDTQELILHEYVHFLMHNKKNIFYPRWYSEGYAELLSTVAREDERIVIGSIPEKWTGWLANGEWIPIRRVIRAGSLDGWSRSEVAMFYAESWALVQFLHFGRPDGNRTAQHMRRYLDLVEAGEEGPKAFEAAFGLRVASLDRTVRRYLGRGVKGLRLSADSFDLTPADPRIRPLTPYEAYNELGTLAIARGDGERAETLFTAALREDPEDARAHAGLGDALKFQKQWQEAEPYFRRAAELSPDDPLIQLDLAEYLHEAALSARPTSERPERLREARRHYARSRELDPSVPETYAMYGRSYLAVGENHAKAIESLEHADSLLPANYSIKFQLARAYALNGREDAARHIVQRLATWSHMRSSADLADKLMRLISRPEDGQAPE
jgi:Flp pilus assembly protein TadD